MNRRLPEDYIDRRKLVTEMRKLISTRMYNEEDMLDVVNEQPRAEVAIIIKCENCEFFKRDEYWGVCHNPQWSETISPLVRPFDFCSYSKRKEN